MASPARSVAERIAPVLVAGGVDRICGPQGGGHFQPTRNDLAQLGVRVVDARNEAERARCHRP